MRIITVFLLLFMCGCQSEKLTEIKARELAVTEFKKTCSKIGVDPVSFKQPVEANVQGSRIAYSYIWYPVGKGRSIIVGVEKDGWTEASFGVDQENGNGKP